MNHASAQQPIWHTLSAEEEVQQRFGVDPRAGLSSAAAQERLATFGRNEIIEDSERRSFLRMFTAQSTDFMILVLVAAAIISGMVGEAQDSIAILVVVALNAVISSVQDYRAEKAVAAPRMLAAPEAHVFRDGEAAAIDAYEVVPGHIIILEAGNVVSADLRLFRSVELKLDESALTGAASLEDHLHKIIDAGTQPTPRLRHVRSQRKP